ncbi:MAG: sulfatase-like hydrolase/transferase [Planctomycetota bacterium]
MAGAERPNILFLMTDQQRWDALGCAGNPIVHTPNLDALAGSGVRFREACTSTPVCVAARMSFITGHRIARHHWTTNSALPGPVPELPTLMTLLLRAGYWTHGVGKMHFRGRHYGLRSRLTMEECVRHAVDDDYIRYLRGRGVRTAFPNGLRDLLYYQPQTSGIPRRHHPNTWVADRSVEFLREHTRYRADQPFFLWSSWIAPHPPFAPCEPYDEMYDPAEVPAPVHTERAVSDLPSTLWSDRARLDGAHRDPGRIRRIRALYYGQISHVDECIGRILDELGSLGLADDTVVLFFSDHGDMLGDHGLSQKGCPYEPAVRVPLLLRWPGRTAAGTACDDLVGLTDVLPTLVEQLGLEYPESEHGALPGASLLAAAGGGLASPRDVFVIDYGHGRKRWIALRSRRYKYAFHACDGGREELYDLGADPHETRDLAAEQPEPAVQFRRRALDWEREHGPPGTLDGDRFRTYPAPGHVPSEDECRAVVLNQGRWPWNLPADERDSVEPYAEAFTRAIGKETTLAPDKLSLAEYKAKGGEPLTGTPWEGAWENA